MKMLGFNFDTFHNTLFENALSVVSVGNPSMHLDTLVPTLRCSGTVYKY